MARAWSSLGDDGGRVGDVLAAGDCDEGALGQVRGRLAVLAGTDEVAGVDSGAGERAGPAGVAAVPGPPHVAGLFAVGVRGRVAHLLEGVAAVSQVLRAVGDELQVAGPDLGAVLVALEVAQVRAEAVDAAVEPLCLGVQHVDEAPEQALALVGELGAVGAGAFGEDAEGLADCGQRVVLVPDLARVELVAPGGGAEEGGVFADGRGGGLPGGLDGVGIEGHDDSFRLHVRGRSPT